MIRLIVLSVSLFSGIASAEPNVTKNPVATPKIKSAAAFVIDIASGEVLFSREPDIQRPIASISKLMGALVIHRHCNLKPDELHTMSTDNRDAAKGGDKTRLTTGWSYSHGDLMKAALMRSDNRALPGLGEACGLTIEALAEKMTAEAKSMGLTQTSFKEPNGLNKENVSTPREIMVFLLEALKVPELAEIMSTRSTLITAHRDGRSRAIEIRNTDRMLSKDIAQVIGGKTGYTDIARYCLAIAARTDDNRVLGMVFLGAEGKHTRFADFTRVIRWLLPTKAYAGEANQNDKLFPATSKNSDFKKSSLDKALPVPENEILKDEKTPNGAPAIKNGGAAMKPQELFEYYW